jgi:hypothetical protein
VTIAAGFWTAHGIVLGSDSEETTGALKLQKTKVALHRTGEIEAVLVGTGDAIFCDMIEGELWQTIHDSPCDSDEIVANLKPKLIDIHQRYHMLSTDKVDYEVDMLIGLHVKDEVPPRLLHALGPSISDVFDFRCIGYGAELGNYIATRIAPSIGTLEEATVLMIYLLQQVKKYVRFCGGDSYIVTISADGKMDKVRGYIETDVTKFLEQFERLIADTLVVFANPDSSSKDLQFAEECLRRLMSEHRGELKRSVERSRKYLLEITGELKHSLSKLNPSG